VKGGTGLEDRAKRLGLPVTISLFLVSLAIDAVMISLMWGWFVHPLNPNLIPRVSILHAVGLVLLIQGISQRDTYKIEGKSVLEVLIDMAVYPVILTALGYIVHLLMWHT
jgi:hypothetical protein